MKYEVIDLRTNKSHGEFDTLDEARGCVAYDRLKHWEIRWKCGRAEGIAMRGPYPYKTA